MIKTRNGGGTTSIGFLPLPDFSMMVLSSCVELLRMAIRLAGQTLYECFVVGDVQTPVQSNGGFSVTPDLSFESAEKLDAVFVCSGSQFKQAANCRIADWLGDLANCDMVLGAAGTGTYLLSSAGVLDGCRCTIHWEHLASLRQAYPDLIISSELFEIDNKRYTCAGGK